jgi:AbrB family looped-hinge helix DNA binding protein
MGDTHHMTVGNKGRVVLPSELRQNRGWSEGTVVIAIETDEGVVLHSREELEEIVRRQLAGSNLVEELIAERRAASLIEDAE